MTVGEQHPVKATFRTDIKPSIGYDRYDLAGGSAVSSKALLPMSKSLTLMTLI
jgi:hypothetical protein